MNKTAITIGKFEGLHLGHQLLLKEVSDVAKNRGYKAVFIKIRMPGKSILTREEEQRFIKENYPAVSDIICYDFNPEFASVSAEDFIKNILIKKFNVGYLAVGNDFRFGKNRQGDVKLLEKAGKENFFDVKVFDKLQVDGEIVSSTRIKEYLEAGDVSHAGKMMGRPFKLSGMVKGGKKLGRTLGYPTINLDFQETQILPGYGVYSSDIIIDGKNFKGITNIGIRPSIDDGNKPTVETFIYNFSDDVYGEIVDIIPTRFIRSERKFDSLDDLTNQIELDILDADRNQ